MQTLIAYGLRAVSWEWNSLTLKEEFGRYGAVSDVFMGRKGYVVMPNESQALVAMEELNLKGDLKVERAHSGHDDETSLLKADLLRAASKVGDNDIGLDRILSVYSCAEIERALQDLLYGNCSTKDKFSLLHLVKDACNVENQQKCRFLIESFETYFFGLLATSGTEDVYMLMNLLVTLPKSISNYNGGAMSKALIEKYKTIEKFFELIHWSPPTEVEPEQYVRVILEEENEPETVNKFNPIDELYERWGPMH